MTKKDLHKKVTVEPRFKSSEGINLHLCSESPRMGAYLACMMVSKASGFGTWQKHVCYWLQGFHSEWFGESITRAEQKSDLICFLFFVAFFFKNSFGCCSVMIMRVNDEEEDQLRIYYRNLKSHCLFYLLKYTLVRSNLYAFQFIHQPDISYFLNYRLDHVTGLFQNFNDYSLPSKLCATSSYKSLQNLTPIYFSRLIFNSFPNSWRFCFSYERSVAISWTCHAPPCLCACVLVIPIGKKMHFFFLPSEL